MVDLLVAAHVTREGDTNLDIHDNVAYRIGSREFSAGALSWRREEATSPFLHGAIVVDAVKDMSKGELALFVLGATHAAVYSNLATLLSAFEQDDYELHVTIESQPYAWYCNQADYEVGISTPFMAGRIVPVNFSYPRQPIPISGPF